jgi:uncharacterized protein (TIGR02001 family)
MMKKTLALLPATLALVLCSQAHAQQAPAPAPAPAAAAPEATLVPKVSLYSEYEYRGISQTSEKPAVQFNLDYTHPSGFYLGTFVSNIKWLKDYKSVGAVADSAAVEIDLFGGYKFEIAKDWTMDVGYLHYEYPSAKGLAGLPKPNTDEIYVGLSYDAWNVKYSYSTGDTFGVPKSKGTTFLELNYSKEIAPKLTLTAQIAQQKYKGNFAGFNNDKELTYSVYKAGLSYDLGDGWTAGGYAKDTNAKEANYTIKGKDWSKARLVAFVSKSF